MHGMKLQSVFSGLNKQLGASSRLKCSMCVILLVFVLAKLTPVPLMRHFNLASVLHLVFLLLTFF